jgi:ABC-2 type transport system ATP-binding protein
MILQTSNLTRRFATILALKSVDLSLEVGEIRGLLGPNGAGKSTALRMICGVLMPSEGEVLINGTSLSHDPVRAKKCIGYLPEGAPLPSELRGFDYLSFVGKMYGLDSSTRKQAIDEWSSRCDIERILYQQIGTLSRGYRQRVGLAAALLHSPALVVLDEPSTGLDPEQCVSFRELIKEVSREAAVLYSSHSLAEVEATCDVVSILCNGRIVADGTFDSLSVGESAVSVEVSPHSIAEVLPTTSCNVIDENWIRCICADILGEKVAKIVADAGGSIRLIQPMIETAEATYLRLIQESQVQT